MAWSRWWLGFDRDRQAALLDHLIGGDRNWLGIWILLAVAASQAVGLTMVSLIRCHSKHQKGLQARERSLQNCLEILKPLHLNPEPGETLEAFCQRVSEEHPRLQASLEQVCKSHQSLIYGQQTKDASKRRRQQQHLWRSLVQLKQAVARS